MRVLTKRLSNLLISLHFFSCNTSICIVLWFVFFPSCSKIKTREALFVFLAAAYVWQNFKPLFTAKFEGQQAMLPHQPWIHRRSLSVTGWTVALILACLSLDVLQTLNLRRKNWRKKKEKDRKKLIRLCQALFFTWHISYFFFQGGVADRLSISRRAHKSRET